MVGLPTSDELTMRRHPMVFLLIAILIALGVALIWAGKNAINSRHYELPWEQGGGFQLGPIGLGNQHQSGVDKFDGPDAVRIGVGWLLFGGMFVFWGLLALWAMIRPKRWEMPRRGAAAMAAISLLLLAGSLLSLLPPWKIGAGIGTTMWITMLLVAALVVCVSRQWLPEKWVKYTLPALILLTLLGLTLVGGRWPWGMILALFAGMALTVHGAMIYVWLRREPPLPPLPHELPLSPPPIIRHA